MATSTFDHVIRLALELSPKEQAQLLEQVAAHLALQIEQESEPQPSTDEMHWGQSVVALVQSFDPNVWEGHDASDDPVEWVKRLRAQQWRDRKLDWGDDEE